ncbi:tetratricopeptide repeat protein [Parablastomonas sp. CN1-191]|uniref:tetratricopeptide repeat protein n=1 Tax=Parablastomonas sp. CN1-191 TaxID=3400908 RepID=UPI003BF81452
MKTTLALAALLAAAPAYAQTASTGAAQPQYDQAQAKKCAASRSSGYDEGIAACTALLATKGITPGAVAEVLSYRAGLTYDAAIANPKGSAKRKALMATADADIAAILASAGADKYRRADAYTARAFSRMIDGTGSPDVDLDRALALVPTAYFALSLRAERREAARNYTGAVADLDAALATIDRIDPDKISEDQADSIELKQAELLNSRCWIKAAWQNADLAAARKDCNASLDIDPAANTYDSLGMVGLRTRDWQGAESAYTYAIKAADTYASPYFGRAIARMRLGRSTDANADLARAIQLDPAVATKYAEKGLKP